MKKGGLETLEGELLNHFKKVLDMACILQPTKEHVPKELPSSSYHPDELAIDVMKCMTGMKAFEVRIMWLLCSHTC